MFVPERRYESFSMAVRSLPRREVRCTIRCHATVTNNPRASRQGSYFFRITQPLWPPRPIEFDSATRTSAFRASFGT
jgi:hypothetical protein